MEGDALRRGLAICLLAAALAAVAAGYVISPFAATWSLAAAAKSGDRDRIEQLVDFPRVRSNLKDQVSARLLAGTGSDLSPRRPLGVLAAVLLPALADRVIDRLVTPDAIAAMLKPAAVPADGADAGAARASDAHAGKAAWGYGYLGLDRFRVTVSDPARGDGPVALTLERRGLFSWKLIRVDLPLDQLGPSGRQPSSTPVPSPPDSSVRSVTAGLPVRIGDCVDTAVKQVSNRLDGVPDSGSAIEYRNGGYQVSYETVDAVQQSRAGDLVHLCLVFVPDECPPGDERGKVYAATDRRTGQTWSLPDAEHMCGGA